MLSKPDKSYLTELQKALWNNPDLLNEFRKLCASCARNKSKKYGTYGVSYPKIASFQILFLEYGLSPVRIDEKNPEKSTSTKVSNWLNGIRCNNKNTKIRAGEELLPGFWGWLIHFHIDNPFFIEFYEKFEQRCAANGGIEPLRKLESDPVIFENWKEVRTVYENTYEVKPRADSSKSVDTDNGGINVPAETPQPQLWQPKAHRDTSINRFTAGKVEFLGRDTEKEILRSFLDADEKFLWLQIAGVAGQGKSRLALEWIRRHAEGWAAGFVTDKEIDRFADQWQVWQPNKPHLLIFDYVIGREDAISGILQALATRAEEDEFAEDGRGVLAENVRVILIERHRWDHGLYASNDGSPSKDYVPSLSSGGGRAEWFSNLIATFDHSDPDLVPLRYQNHSFRNSGQSHEGESEPPTSTFQNGVLELFALSEKHLIDLVIDTSEEIGKPVRTSREEIGNILKQINPDGRPLYAYFLGQVLGWKAPGELWTQQSLLHDVLQRDLDERWSAEFGRGNLEIGNDTPAMRLAVLATILKNLEVTPSTKKNPLLADICDMPTRRQAMVITDTPRGKGKSATGKMIAAIEPDLLGEWFVIECFSEDIPAADLMVAAWNLNPRRTAEFLKRLTDDFPTNEIVEHLLDFDFPSGSANEAEFEALGTQINAIVRNLGRASAKSPAKIISLMKRGARRCELDRERSVWLNALSYCYQWGFGVSKSEKKALLLACCSAHCGDPAGMYGFALGLVQGKYIKKDEAAAFNWLSKGAEIDGGARCKGALGWCYQSGFGVSEDKSKAVKIYREAAETGDAQAMRFLGVCYRHGTGVEQDVAEAVRWYRKAAEAGDTSAMLNLGVCFEHGAGVEQDVADAVGWYRKAAEAGDANAMVNLGACYRHGTGVEQDEAKAVGLYRKAAEAGDAKAMANLGVCFEHGTGIEQDEAEAVRWYRKAAEAGDARAMGNLGVCFEHGTGVEQDVAEALGLYRKAAEAGDANAMVNLGVCYERGTGIEQDEAEAVRWYRKAAEAGDARAMGNLGVCFEHGTGVEQDVAEAVRWYRKAAEADDANAMVNLGICYRHGTGVEQDEAKAVGLYRKAAEAGDTTAMVSLGFRYEHGSGIEQDEAEAVRWYRKAAEAGDARAMGNLGICYHQGNGVEQDVAEAVGWYRKAAEAGDAAAMAGLRNRLAFDTLVRKTSSVRPQAQAWADARSTDHRASDWADKPLIPLRWRNLASKDDIIAHLLVGIHEAIEIQDDLAKLDGAVCEAIRVAEAPFYPGHQFAELQMSCPSDENSVPQLLTAVCGEHGAILLTGQSDVIHLLNSHCLALSDEGGVSSYLHFYCAYVHGPDGPFYLPSWISDIPLSKPPQEVFSEDILTAGFELEHVEGRFENEGWHRTRGLVLYDAQLFQATFKVFRNGMVEMENDEMVVADLPILRRQFNGPFRTAPR